jgi:hypothetical protein
MGMDSKNMARLSRRRMNDSPQRREGRKENHHLELNFVKNTRRLSLASQEAYHAEGEG